PFLSIQMSAIDLIARTASLMMSLCPLRSSTAATILMFSSDRAVLLPERPDRISIWEAFSKLISNLLKAPTSEPLTYYEYSLILGQLHELAMLNACSEMCISNRTWSCIAILIPHCSAIHDRKSGTNQFLTWSLKSLRTQSSVKKNKHLWYHKKKDIITYQMVALKCSYYYSYLRNKQSIAGFLFLGHTN
ncbi:unnamed protein product, partial [Owenia fusiformis]